MPPPDEFDYEFSVWPEERGTWEHSVFDLFRLYPRVIMTMTEDQFVFFRASLERTGLTLRECERVPHFDPESLL